MATSCYFFEGTDTVDQPLFVIRNESGIQANYKFCKDRWYFIVQFNVKTNQARNLSSISSKRSCFKKKKKYLKLDSEV